MGDSSITLFIQAHGEEFKNERFMATNENVHLLSFPGIYGEDGKMITQDDGTPVDIFILEILRDKYMIVNPTTARTQQDIYYGINHTLKTTYEEDFGIQFNNGGFRYTNPRLERKFTFKANKGECSTLCPEYGLTIVSSFTREYGDNTISRNFTLSGDKSRSSSNLHMNEAVREFWIKKSYDSVKKNGLHVESGQFLNDIFTKMFNNPKEIKLSELIRWCNIMGYLNIYIYDPSCRSTTDYEDKMELALIEKRYQDMLRMTAKERWMKAFNSVTEVPKKLRKKTYFPRKEQRRKKYANYPLLTSAIKQIKEEQKQEDEEDKGDDYNQEIPYGHYYTDYQYLDNQHSDLDNQHSEKGFNDYNQEISHGQYYTDYNNGTIEDYTNLAISLNEPENVNSVFYLNTHEPGSSIYKDIRLEPESPIVQFDNMEHSFESYFKPATKRKSPGGLETGGLVEPYFKPATERKSPGGLERNPKKTKTGGKHKKQPIKKNHKTRTIRKHKKRTTRNHKKSKKRTTRRHKKRITRKR